MDSKDVAGAGPANDDSEGFSSTWAAALPRLVQRRNGLTGAIALGLKRSNSQDSNLNLSRSVSIRSKRFNYNSSMNSRRHSVADSGLAGTDAILLFAWLTFVMTFVMEVKNNWGANLGFERVEDNL